MTHVVAPGLKRNQKCMAALAAGAWVVGKEYVAACKAAGELLSPVGNSMCGARVGAWVWVWAWAWVGSLWVAVWVGRLLGWLGELVHCYVCGWVGEWAGGQLRG